MKAQLRILGDAVNTKMKSVLLYVLVVSASFASKFNSKSKSRPTQLKQDFTGKTLKKSHPYSKNYRTFQKPKKESWKQEIRKRLFKKLKGVIKKFAKKGD